MKRSIATWAAVLYGLWLVGVAGPRAAFADEGWTVVQITCAPEACYFSIRRLLLMNPRDNYDEHGYEEKMPVDEFVAKLATHGIYTSNGLKETPLECDLLGAATTPDGKRSLRIRAQGFFHAPAGSMSLRAITNHVEVSANGKRLGYIFLGGYAFMATTTDMMEVDFNGGEGDLTTCSYLDHREAGDPTKGCKSLPLSAVKEVP